MSGFDALLAEIGELSKGTAADLAKAEDKSDDKKIDAAAADGEAAGDADAAAGGDDKDGKKPDGDDDDKPMAKSFSFKLEDGTTVDAIDAGELLKSLTDRVEGNESLMLKAVSGLLGTIKAQGSLIKSLGDKLEAIGNSGRGRKAVISVTEKPAAGAAAATLAKGGEEGTGMEPREFLAKSLAAVAAGRITGHEAAYAEVCINGGNQPPAELVRRVIGSNA